MIRCIRKVRRVAVTGKEITWHIVVRTESANRCRIVGRERTVLGTTIGAGWRDPRDPQVMNHPSLVPPRLVVDDEQSRDVRK